jgi:hypothetical protein
VRSFGPRQFRRSWLSLLLGLGAGVASTVARAQPAPVIAPPTSDGEPEAVAPASTSPSAPPPAPAGALIPPGPDPTSPEYVAVSEQRPIIRYRKGDALLPGYHLGKRPRTAPIVTGLAVFGSAYVVGGLLSASEGFPNQSGFLLVPVLGPWITISQRTRPVCTFACQANGKSQEYGLVDVFLVFDGLMQGAGALLVALGYAMPRTWQIRDDVALSFTPAPVGERGYGAAVHGRF